MPRPRYILCAERRLTDAYSGLITHVNVIELLALSDPSERKEVSHELHSAPAMQWMVTSVWMRDDTDEDQQFESQLLMHLPGVDEPRILVENDIVFKTVFYRMEALLLGPIAQQGGMLRFEGRIRPKGSAGPWISQEFLIPVEVRSATQQTPSASELPDQVN